MVSSNPVDPARSKHVCSSLEPCIECFANSNLAADLTPDQVRELFGIAKLRHLAKGEVLISENSTDGPLFVLARGELEVARAIPGDSSVSLARLRPGMLAGQFAFVGGLKRTATLTSSADGTFVFAIERSDVEKLLGTDPLLVYRLMQAIVRSASITLDEMNRGFGESIRYIRG